MSSSDFLRFLAKNEFIKYVDGYVAVNIPGFIINEGGKLTLSKTALLHLNECTLDFVVDSSQKIHTEEANRFSLLFSSETTARSVQFNNEELNRIVNMYKQQNVETQHRFFKDFRVKEGENYSEYLITLMERHNVSIRGLVKESKVSKSVIDKYRSYTQAAYTIPITLSLCAGMKAYPYETFNLLKKMGVDIEGTVRSGEATDRNKCYYHLIVKMYDQGIDAWNEYLKAHNQPTL